MFEETDNTGNSFRKSNLYVRGTRLAKSGNNCGLYTIRRYKSQVKSEIIRTHILQG